MDNIMPLRKKKIGLIGRTVQALGILAMYTAGFIVVAVVMAWATGGFNLDWLEWLELGVASILGVGLYFCSAKRAEEIAGQHESVGEIMLNRLAMAILVECPFIVVSASVLILVFLSLMGVSGKDIGATGLLAFFFSLVVGISIVYVYDLLVPREKVGEDLFEVLPDGAGYRIRTLPGARRFFRNRNNRKVIKSGDITIEDSPADNRLRIFFPGKPNGDVRAMLKSNGFKWAPSIGAWQAYRNPDSLRVARLACRQVVATSSTKQKTTTPSPRRSPRLS